MDEPFAVYLLMFTVYIPPHGFRFMPPVKPTMSIKVSLSSQRALLSQWLSLSSTHRLFRSAKLCYPDTWQLTGVEKARATLLHAVIRNGDVVSIPRHRTEPLPPHQHLRGGSCMTIRLGESIRRKHIFFSSHRCLFNSCSVLLFTGFHIYPHTV